MKITLTSNEPDGYKPYKLSYDEKLRVRDIVNDLLSKDIIRESESAHASPVILVKKKDVHVILQYWSDNKSATKKKGVARVIARRNAGGGVGELTEVEERIVTLLGGEYFATGDIHLRIHLFDIRLSF
ncbi:hypothetical protein EVAR_41139_1 [Eumeta japonica]|uniref:Uncharacterized protein n=1 Tax=Eumeta variegata TaxID=151549 RepID=A0A4C1YC27_EUMVA|nr:hypothetical protein EVAR_41139_1 [Eumeta japonica]